MAGARPGCSPRTRPAASRTRFGPGSSLPGHIRATRIGIEQAFKHPFGHGTGSVTIAANRYGHSRTVGTEFDPGNMGIAFGILGLAVYVAFTWYAIKTTYRAAVIRRDVVSIFGIGLLMATLFQWTNGDLYSVCWLIWLFIGYLDVTMAKLDARAAHPRRVAVAPAQEWRRPGAPRRRSGTRVSRLRVAYVAHSVDPARGGMELVSARLLERLAASVDLEVVAGDGLDTLPRGVRRTRVPIPSAAERRAPRALRPVRDACGCGRCGGATTSCTPAARSPTRASTS